MSVKKPDTYSKYILKKAYKKAYSKENDNYADSLKNPVINISHTPQFENFDSKKKNLKIIGNVLKIV